MYFKVLFCIYYYVIYLNFRFVRVKLSVYFGRGMGLIYMDLFIVVEMRGFWYCVYFKDLFRKNVIIVRMLGLCVNENVNVYINCFLLI